MRILLVDDSKAIHNFVKAAADENEWNIESCFNGKEAVEYLGKDSNFDLILLDWEMPVMSGPDALQKIKVDHPSLCVVMLTSRNRPKDIKKMLESGAQDYLMKPVTSEILSMKIKDAVDAI